MAELERRKSDCNDNPSGSNDCLLLQRRANKHHHREPTTHQPKKNDQIVTRIANNNCDEIEHLRAELESETKNRNEAQRKYSELHRKMEAFVQRAEETKKNPDSKYDALIHKQNCVNDTVNTQINEAKEKLAALTHSLKSIQVCGKDCQLNSKDLILNYDCMNKNEILKEIKRFERMQIELKSNLDRLQCKIDHESKEYYNLADQFQKLTIELYYLQNLNDKHSSKAVCW